MIQYSNFVHTHCYYYFVVFSIFATFVRSMLLSFLPIVAIFFIANAFIFIFAFFFIKLVGREYTSFIFFFSTIILARLNKTIYSIYHAHVICSIVLLFCSHQTFLIMYLVYFDFFVIIKISYKHIFIYI